MPINDEYTISMLKSIQSFPKLPSLQNLWVNQALPMVSTEGEVSIMITS